MALRNVPCTRVLSRERISRSIFRRCARGRGPACSGAPNGPSSIGSPGRDRSAIDGPNIGTPELFLGAPSLPPKKNEKKNERERETDKGAEEAGDEGERKADQDGERRQLSGLLLDIHTKEPLSRSSSFISPPFSHSISFPDLRNKISPIRATRTINSSNTNPSLNRLLITNLYHQFTIFRSLDSSSFLPRH